MTDWMDLASGVLDIGAQVFAGQLQKKAARQAARAGSSDFPQLGMGLAATGPQRGMVTSRVGIFDSSGAGVGYSSSYGLDDSGGSTMGDVAVMGGPGPRSRFPTQLVVYTTPSGAMKVGGYRSIGQPLAWSSDFAAVRRLARLRRRLGAGHRRPR